ncbi:transcriptional regulator [Clostridiales bacterium PH28_bin88]|nr:transcriptional regulator [Clostridiales bacterium PH28_bin88]
MGKILVVDDEESIVELVKFNLEKEGHHVLAASDGNAALELAESENPDVIVLDVMLPGRDGFEVCRLLHSREATAGIPVIMLTAKGEEFDKVLGLELGADDYVTKPFSPRELAARVKACIRRRAAVTQPVARDTAGEMRAGELVMRPEHYQVFLHGQPVELAPKEFELLRILMQNPGKVLKRDHLLDQVWGYDYAADTRTVDVHIRYLRQKIETDPGNPRYIETVRGVGYRFKEMD